MCKDQKRDPATGQFVKGGGGNATSFTKDNAAEMAQRAHASRLRNAHGRELVRAVLEHRILDSDICRKLKADGYDVDEMTHELALIVRQVEKGIRKGDTAAFREIFRAAGYLDDNTINVNLSGTEDGPPVIVFAEPKSKLPTNKE